MEITCHDSLDTSFQNLGDLDSRIGGCGTQVISDLFFKYARRQRHKTQDLIDPQLVSASQPKAWGLLHMECEFNRTPYKRRQLLRA
jgi:hypothetical protein